MKTFKSIDCNGQVLIIVAVVLIVLIAVVGLAIDSGRAYGVKAKLNAALDAASIAAAMALSEGEDAAETAAENYFDANYPDGYMGSHPEFDPDGIIPPEPYLDGNIIIDVRGSAEMSTTFMRILGYETVTVSAHAQAIRRAVDLAFVVDNTGSIGSAGPDVKLRSIDFVNHFFENFDRLALIKYAYGAEVEVPIRTDIRGFPLGTVEDKIGQFTFSGYTNCAEGFWQGLDQLEAVTDQSKIRVIVFFTDGAPNTFSSYFEFDTPDPQRGSIRSGDGSTGNTAGLRKHDDINQQIPSPYNFGNTIANHLSGLPEFYNAHTTDLTPSNSAVYTEDPNDPDYHKFRVITGQNGSLFGDANPGARLVEQYEGTGGADLFDKVNDASRNLLEAMAKNARQQGIYVYTLGLGSLVTQNSGPEQKPGAIILKRMANDKDADIRFPDEPVGFYCHALTSGDLEPCFNQIVQEITRLTM